MKENSDIQPLEAVEVETMNQEVDSPIEANKEKIDPGTTHEEEPKKGKKKKVTPPVEESITITPDPEPTELDKLKTELEAMMEEKRKLEEEKTALNETITKLQEEVKITPQKLATVVKQMGIAPLSVSRENPQAMTIEGYNSMTDSARREWQRTHRADYLAMMHKVKISN